MPVLSCPEPSRDLLGTPQQAIQRHDDTIRCRSRAGIQVHQRNSEFAVHRRMRQPLGMAPEIDHKAEPGRRIEGKPHDAESPHLQKAGDRRRWAGDAAIDVNLIIGHEFKTPGDQPQHQIGFT